MQFRHYRSMASTTPRRPMLSVLHQKTIFFFLFFSFLSFFLSFFFFISFYFFISIYTTNHWRIGLMLHTLLTIRILMKFLQGRTKKISCRLTHPICSTLHYANFLYLKRGKKVGNKFCLPHPMLHCPIPSQMCVCIFYIVYFYIYYSSLIIFKTFYYHLLITPLFHS